MSIKERIRSRRLELNLTLEDVANSVGVSKPTVLRWESGDIENMRSDKIEKLAKALHTTPAYLMCWTDSSSINDSYIYEPLQDEIPINDNYPVPLLGSVVAGIPIEAQEDLESYIYISFRPPEEYFALRVHGDSMKNACILDKSILICHKQETAESGEIVVAMLNGEQTVKRYRVYDNYIYLQPENQDYPPIPVKPGDEFKILGKVVEIRVEI